MTAVDKAKTVTEVAHAFLWCLLVVLVLLFLSFQSARKYVAQMAGDAHIKSVSEKGLDFDLEEVKDKSLQLVEKNVQLRMTQDPLPRNQDLMPDPNAVALLHAIHQAAPETSDKGEFWVYVGEYNQQTHSFGNPLNFDVTAPPAVNSTITASQDVYERDVKPYKDAGGWHLGTIKGVLPRGKTVRVQDAARIEGENDYDFNSWVKVKPQ